MNVSRMIAIPVLSAGILGGALGLASTAAAAVSTTSTTDSHSIVAAPDRWASSPNDMSKSQRKRAERQHTVRNQ
jgi:hypothetical protein